MPLEWDPVTGRKGNIDRDVKAADGTVIEQLRYRAIVPGSSWNERLDLSDPEDVEFLALVQDWIARSRDPRIAHKKVRVIIGGNAEPEPLERYESRKVETILTLLGAMMDDSDEANRDLLLRVARYELQREGGPRGEIMRFVEAYDESPGVYAGDDQEVFDAGDDEIVGGDAA